MNEKLPYEQQLQQQWTDIPLPDENMAWDDMARRLEEDDDKPVVFWWRPGCGLLALLLVLVGLGWWIFRPEKHFTRKGNDTVQQITTTKEQERSGNNKQSNTPPEKNNDTNNPAPAGNEVTPTDEEAPVAAPREGVKKTGEAKEPDQETQVKDKDKKSNPQESVRQQKNGKRENTRRLVSSDHAPVYVTATKKAGNKKGRGSKSGTGKTTEQQLETTGSSAIDQTEPNKINTSDTTDKQDTTNKQDTTGDEPVKKDSVKKSRPPSAAKQAPPAADSNKKNKLFFSAGLSLQQQIPLAGQKPTPYSSTGRKGSLADYIPSVYMRLNKKDKWFLQAEFRYGAPQYSKEFTYHQASIPDTGSNPQFVTNSSARLKKTFYHQLPITFNYFVKPNWSVGGGVIWNKFYAALSDQETIKHDLNTQTDEVVFKGLVSVKDDTSGTFASSYLQAVIESQYKWKRFSFGARYAFGLQPYIRFTLPGQGTREERNSNLQLFLRFELIRPKQD